MAGWLGLGVGFWITYIDVSTCSLGWGLMRVLVVKPELKREVSDP